MPETKPLSFGGRPGRWRADLASRDAGLDDPSDLFTDAHWSRTLAGVHLRPEPDA
jgi:hypothetical protein